jgi:hypothetical protein
MTNKNEARRWRRPTRKWLPMDVSLGIPRRRKRIELLQAAEPIAGWRRQIVEPVLCLRATTGYASQLEEGYEPEDTIIQRLLHRCGSNYFDRSKTKKYSNTS